jgi:L-amino acid N-acyltransferase YncA
MDIIIGHMQPTDWEQVRRVYLDGLASGQASFETAAPTWEDWDESRLRHSRLVARADDQVIGWAALSPVSGRSCYAGVAEASVYIAAGSRGQGVGKALLEALIEESERNGIWRVARHDHHRAPQQSRGNLTPPGLVSSFNPEPAATAFEWHGDRNNVIQRLPAAVRAF